ncbi:MAG TPA: orotidine-5'-phosphate decarboxylase [Acidimicrobiales bacterium]|nr:orotidine-5'-phosphate decarboxylase [Acidimicrobiales bacterium]
MPDAAIRDRLALVLDLDDLVAAERLAKRLAPWFGVAKVGLELFSAAGPEAVTTLRASGYRVFLDVKLHDIPTTVNHAARVLGALGASYLTLHAAGGPVMLSAGVEGLASGADAAGLPAPIALGVTVLTSEREAPAALFDERLVLAVEAGCGGFVCAASEVHHGKLVAPRLVAVVPGIRLAGDPVHDQGRPATPREAIDAGADLLVIGRSVTHADDPAAAAEAVHADIANGGARSSATN